MKKIIELYVDAYPMLVWIIPRGSKHYIAVYDQPDGVEMEIIKQDQLDRMLKEPTLTYVKEFECQSQH